MVLVINDKEITTLVIDNNIFEYAGSDKGFFKLKNLINKDIQLDADIDLYNKLTDTSRASATYGTRQSAKMLDVQMYNKNVWIRVALHRWHDETHWINYTNFRNKIILDN